MSKSAIADLLKQVDLTLHPPVPTVMAAEDVTTYAKEQLAKAQDETGPARRARLEALKADLAKAEEAFAKGDESVEIVKFAEPEAPAPLAPVPEVSAPPAPMNKEEEPPVVEPVVEVEVDGVAKCALEAQPDLAALVALQKGLTAPASTPAPQDVDFTPSDIASKAFRDRVMGRSKK